MSVTFTIQGNQEYVDAHCPEKIRHTSYECQCQEFSEDKRPDPTCFECHGSGRISVQDYPFEVNLANANFRTLMNALGLDRTADFGEIDPRALVRAIRRTPTALLCREDRQEGERFYFQGIDEVRAQSYLSRLLSLAEEAERREEKVYWG